MVVAAPARTVMVVRFGSVCGPGVSRAALRGRWDILDGNEPGLVRRIMQARASVLVVQLSDVDNSGLMMVQRLSRHWNPVFSVVVGPRSGVDCEVVARMHGAAAYVPHEVDQEFVEALASQLSVGYAGTPLDRGAESGNVVLPGVTRVSRPAWA